MLVFAAFLHVIAVASPDPVSAVDFLAQSSWITLELWGFSFRAILALFRRFILTRCYLVNVGLSKISEVSHQTCNWGKLYLNLIDAAIRILIFRSSLGLRCAYRGSFCRSKQGSPGPRAAVLASCCIREADNIDYKVISIVVVMITKESHLSTTNVLPILGG